MIVLARQNPRHLALPVTKFTFSRKKRRGAFGLPESAKNDPIIPAVSVNPSLSGVCWFNGSEIRVETRAPCPAAKSYFPCGAFLINSALEFSIRCSLLSTDYLARENSALCIRTRLEAYLPSPSSFFFVKLSLPGLFGSRSGRSSQTYRRHRSRCKTHHPTKNGGCGRDNAQRRADSLLLGLRCALTVPAGENQADQVASSPAAKLGNSQTHLCFVPNSCIQASRKNSGIRE